MKRSRFNDVLEASFFPELCVLGFKGNTWCRRRLVEPFLHCVRVQDSSDHARVYLNIGVHITTLPAPEMGRVPLEKMTDEHCEIRDRLNPQSRKGEWTPWWLKTDPEKATSEMLQLFKAKALPFFDQFQSFPGVLDSITVADIESGKASRILAGMTDVRMALLLARLHEHLGNKDKVMTFAEYGLRVAGRATSPIAYFKQMLKRNLA
jgi:hypothetical protein